MSSPLLDAWVSQHPRLAPHLVFVPAATPSRRCAINARAVAMLQKFSTYLGDAIAEIEQSVSLLAGEDALSLGRAEYDDASALLLAREVAFVTHRIQKREIRMLTVQFAVLSELRERAHCVLELFCSEALPPEFGCQVTSTFFDVVYGDVVARDMRALAYLRALLGRLKGRLLQKQVAPWKHFHAWLRQLAQRAQARSLPSEGYFAPFDGEVSLSRALFHRGSPYLQEIDAFVDRLAAGGGAAFQESAIALLGVSMDADARFRSAVLLMFFRCVFDRVYERYPHLFAPNFDPRFAKLEQLAAMPANLFMLTKDLFSVDLESVSIAALFRAQQFYHAAAQFYEDAVFAVNPIDALFFLNKVMVGVRKAALIGQMGNAPASVVDINRALPFDDLFALLFGTLLASGPPIVDIFHLASLVERFTPRQSLSPSLGFAKANLEALCAHLDGLDIDAMKASMAGDAGH
jgi:hypothetical protein